MESFHSSIQDGDHCLALASLFKESFSIDWLIEITGYKASHIFSVLDEGIQQGWLSGLPGGFFIFKEERIQNYWKERLAISEKHSLHQQIATLLAKELPENQQKIVPLNNGLARRPTSSGPKTQAWGSFINNFT